MVATLSSHSEILAIYEASRKFIWLKSMIYHIRESCELSSMKDAPTILFEDNANLCCTNYRMPHQMWHDKTHIIEVFLHMSFKRETYWYLANTAKWQSDRFIHKSIADIDIQEGT